MHVTALRLPVLLLGVGALLSGCADAPSDADSELAYEPTADSEPEDIDPAFFRAEGLYALKANVRTVGELSRSGACSTAAAEALTLQIAEELACLRPDTLVRIDGTPGVSLGAAANPWLQPTTAASMASAARSHALVVNSTWRSVAQQYLLKSWQGRCGIRVAANPGRSAHESGLAIDVDNYASSSVRSALAAAGLTWYCREMNGGRLSGCADPLHFTGRGRDLRADGVRAFQRLWNRNHPEDRIAEDGAWGPNTSARMQRSPLSGFSQVARCGAEPEEEPVAEEPATPPADPCEGLTLDGSCRGDTVARCVEGRIVTTDCGSLGRTCAVDATGAVCLDVDAKPVAPAADPCADMPAPGRCEGDVALWCDAGQLRRHDCSVSNQACGYVDDTLGYYCVPRPSPPAENAGGGAAEAAEDPGYAADGECTPLELEDFSAADTGGAAGESVSRCVQRISRAGSNLVDCRYGADGPWYLTTFGGGSDSQGTACGGRNADGGWYYAANAHRFGCGARFKLWNDRGCVIVQVADVGPHVCVEEAAGAPVWDVSPLAARILTGYSSAGWSERIAVFSEPVASNTALGACD